MSINYILTDAIIDSSKKYRYSLKRQMDFSGPKVTFILSNPSTADALEDDPTIRRCRGFALNWGCAEFEVVNLFAYRATHPSELHTVSNPIGPENDKYIVKSVKDADLIVAAWGTHGKMLKRNQQVRVLLQEYDISCFGLTKCGNPKHPLFLPTNSDLIFW